MIDDLPLRISILDDRSAIIAGQYGRRLAALVGFSLVDQTAMSAAVLEIARNIVKYAGRGEVIMDVVRADDRQEIVVTARDNGPGIPDIDLAMQDGYSTGKSLGVGLPGARRLVDQFEITSAPGQGTTVVLKKSTAPSAPSPITVGCARKTYPGEAAMGDRHVVEPFSRGVLVGVVGGLDYSADAAVASQVAVDILKANAHIAPQMLIRRCDKRLNRTVGASLALASFNAAFATLSWLSVGTVRGCLVQMETGSTRLLPHNAGIVGTGLATMRPVVVPLTVGDRLVIVTDGISERYLDGVDVEAAPQVIADAVLGHHNPGTDDALVVVARLDRSAE